jgi:uncharacterized membrane protein
LTLSSAGFLNGIPTAGTYNFTLQVTDAASTSLTRAYSVLVSAPFVNITSTLQSLSTDSNGQFVAKIGVTNQGNITAGNVTLTSAKLGAAGAVSLPTIPSLSAGGSSIITITFPPSAGTRGSAVLLLFRGAYTATLPGGGSTSGTWGASLRVTLP